MRTKLARIGNSQGVRIPRPLIEEAGLEGDLEMSVQDGAVVIRKAAQPRAGWGQAFAAMAARGDDALLVDPGHPVTSFDAEEWEWQ